MRPFSCFFMEDKLNPDAFMENECSKTEGNMLHDKHGYPHQIPMLALLYMDSFFNDYHSKMEFAES